MCKIDIGNPKYTTFTKFAQVRSFLLPLSYSTWRERHNLSMLTAFTSAPNHARHPICKLLVLSRRAPKVNLPVRTQEPNSLLFLKSPKSSAHASGAWRHSHPLVTFPIWDFILTYVNDASSPHAREHMRSCLHLTNPCTEPKDSHPN